jgi:hypothetical protein
VILHITVTGIVHDAHLIDVFDALLVQYCSGIAKQKMPVVTGMFPWNWKAYPALP